MRRLRPTLALLAIALLAAACGGTASTGTTTASPTPAAASGAAAAVAATTAAAAASATTTTTAPAATTLTVRASHYGPAIFDQAGRVLYAFDADTGPTSTCYGACAKAWPPLLVQGAKPAVASGLDASLVGTTTRTDGTVQATYNGHPLYYYEGDKPGQVMCQHAKMHGGVWLILRPNGTPNMAMGAMAMHGSTAHAMGTMMEAHARLTVVSSKYGRTIADAHGQALYLFDADTTATSTCYGACAKAWPPLLTHGAPSVGAGLDPTLVGTTKRRDGTLQVTYRGHPLYLFEHDKPGTIACQHADMNGGLWLIVKPDGTPNMAGGSM